MTSGPVTGAAGRDGRDPALPRNGDEPGADYTVVVPTIGRPSLHVLLDALARAAGPVPHAVIVVDDRAPGVAPLPLDRHDELKLTVVGSGGRGPAAARNTGWRTAVTEWVAFLDDDVVPGAGWRAALAADLADLPWSVAGSQGRLRVPLPTDRRPTDWERNVAGLEHAQWATADLAYRRSVLEEVGGFDERFPRAFREDADLGLRVVDAGYLIVQGDRRIDHPVRPAGPWVSVRLQAGNADDVLMRARHGSGWRVAAGAEGSRNGRHVTTAAGAALAVAGALTGNRRRAITGTTVWAAGTAELLAARLRPGPKTAREVATMAATSAAIPLAAVGHIARGAAGLPRQLGDRKRAPLGLPRSPLALHPARLASLRAHRPRAATVDPGWVPKAVLFDRDGTLVVDVPYNGDSERVVLMPACAAVHRLRDEGVAVGVVTNQSGIGRGIVTAAEVDSVNQRIGEMIGPFGTWQICPHAPGDRCACRKPAPGLIVAAARALGVEPADCAVIGDIASDMAAARRAGARAVLVPTPVTRRSEIAGAPVVAPTVLRAVDLVLAGMC